MLVCHHVHEDVPCFTNMEGENMRQLPGVTPMMTFLNMELYGTHSFDKHWKLIRYSVIRVYPEGSVSVLLSL